MHEDYARKTEVNAGSEKGFGLVFAVVFALIGCWPLISGSAPRWWSLAIALVFIVLAFLLPQWLRPLNRLWFLFGLLLHRIVNPLIMGIMFFLVVTPTALLMRLFGKDPLRLKDDGQAGSYWIKREPPGPEPESLKNQF